MKKLWYVILGAVLGMGLFWIYDAYVRRSIGALWQRKESVSGSALQLRDTMRRLWIDHIIWTRQCLLGALSESKELDLLVQRLRRNKQELADLFGTYYGDEARQKIAALLNEHVSIALDLVKAAKENKKMAAWGYDSQMTKNAHELASYLSSLNPVWGKKQLKELLDEHLELTKELAVARWQEQCAADLAAFDKIHAQIVHVADELSAGIVAQFPEKFKAT